MEELKIINCIIYITGFILWVIWLPHVLYYTGNNTNWFIYTYHIMNGFTNTVPICPLGIIIPPGIFYFKNIQTVFFRITISI